MFNSGSTPAEPQNLEPLSLPVQWLVWLSL